MTSKDKILAHVGDGIAGNKFRMTKVEFPEIEKCLVTWFRETRDKPVVTKESK